MVLAPDGAGWAAQAIEADYAAGGGSEVDARMRFRAGLEATARLNLEKHGDLSRLLRPAPPEAWGTPARSLERPHQHAEDMARPGRPAQDRPAAIGPTGSHPLVELGRTTTHDLFPIDDALRESLAAKDVAVPDGTAGIVPWNLARNENESITSMHRLDADCRTG